MCTSISTWALVRNWASSTITQSYLLTSMAGTSSMNTHSVDSPQRDSTVRSPSRLSSFGLTISTFWLRSL